MGVLCGLSGHQVCGVQQLLRKQNLAGSANQTEEWMITMTAGEERRKPVVLKRGSTEKLNMLEDASTKQ
jgi:hypothetical protein